MEYQKNKYYEIAIVSDIGERKENEDAYGIDVSEENAAVVVCDGMGGFESGKLASGIAVNELITRSVLCPVHFLFFVLRAGGHNGVQLCVLREAVNKRDGGVPEEQQPFAGIGMGHIGKLVGADPKLFG